MYTRVNDELYSCCRGSKEAWEDDGDLKLRLQKIGSEWRAYDGPADGSKVEEENMIPVFTSTDPDVLQQGYHNWSFGAHPNWKPSVFWTDVLTLQ